VTVRHKNKEKCQTNIHRKHRMTVQRQNLNDYETRKPKQSCWYADPCRPLTLGWMHAEWLLCIFTKPFSFYSGDTQTHTVSWQNTTDHFNTASATVGVGKHRTWTGFSVLVRFLFLVFFALIFCYRHRNPLNYIKIYLLFIMPMSRTNSSNTVYSEWLNKCLHNILSTFISITVWSNISSFHCWLYRQCPTTSSE